LNHILKPVTLSTPHLPPLSTFSLSFPPTARRFNPLRSPALRSPLSARRRAGHRPGCRPRSPRAASSGVLQVRGEDGLQRRGGGRRVHLLAGLDGGGSSCVARRHGAGRRSAASRCWVTAGWCGESCGRRRNGAGRRQSRKGAVARSKEQWWHVEGRHARRGELSPWPPGRAAAQQRRGRRLLRPLRHACVQRGPRYVCLAYVCQ
jgi:hypothetical protein